MKQIANPELVDGLSGYFQRTNSIVYSFGNIISYFLSLRHLRAYYPMTSVNELGNVFDLSGQGRTLTNTNSITFASSSIMTYANLVGASSMYFTRTVDEAGLDITADLTAGGWFYFNTAARVDGIFQKWNGTGLTNQRSWALYKTVTPRLFFSVSSLGTAASVVSVQSTVTPSVGWNFIVGRYKPSVELAIFVNGVKTVNVAGIPAAIFNSSQPLEAGIYRGTPDYLDGRMRDQFISATVLEDCFINALYWNTCPFFGVKP